MIIKVILLNITILLTFDLLHYMLSDFKLFIKEINLHLIKIINLIVSLLAGIIVWRW